MPPGDSSDAPPADGEGAARPPTLSLNAGDHLALYAASRFLPSDLKAKLGLRIPFDVYFQDPLVAAMNPKLAFDECLVPWEPGLGDGPTSARFAVVDYDAHTETLSPAAEWDRRRGAFTAPDGTVLDRCAVAVPEFRQLHIWALAQRALDFFESGFGLGRRISWGFAGNRLILVPQAGPGENAFYDRQSHSLQFYYFDRPAGRVFTCLSADIVHHELGHAVLDGVRPLYNEATSPETAAFHEFAGDLTAILMALRNTPFRQHLIESTGGDISRESTLTNVAEEFGKNVEDRPYLRSALNDLTMAQAAGDQRPHYLSQVLTGAMFDIVIRLSKYYVAKRRRTVPEAFWNTIQRMQNWAIQPLDLLPPVDVTFRDYALAVLRADEIASPMDPDDYRSMMLDAFISRGILDEEDRARFNEPHHVFNALDVDVFHDVDSFAGSPADAYRFLDDNRRKLFIPPNADVTVVELSTAQKLTRQARRLPKQVLLQYVWREDVALTGPQFGRFEGETTSLLCGGTLALDQNGELLEWARKPGSQPSANLRSAEEEQRGATRRAELLAALARRVKSGRIGSVAGGEKGILPKSMPPLVARRVDGALRFELTPHFGIHDDVEDLEGGRAWQISS